jgi:carboxyl-terminal processing protease
VPLRNFVVICLAALLAVLCYQRADRNRYAGTLAEAMNLVTNEYVEEVEPRKLFKGAMEGIVGQLDRYSGYTSAEDFAQLQEDLQGEFGGIGIMVRIDPESTRLMVLSPLVGAPAHKAGLKAGDTILEISGKDTKGMTFQDSVGLMRGKKGTSVKLKVQHAGEEQPFEVTLVRDTIPIESVLGDSRRPDGAWNFRLSDKPQVGYIRIAQFDEHTTRDTENALRQLLDGGDLEGLILDLRGNAGGLLDAAVEICDMFLDSGVIVTTRGRSGDIRSQQDAEPGVLVPPKLPVAILVNQDSASASEIVAACLQDHKRAKIVGQRTWGKGTVQHVIDLEGGRRGALRLTVATYWRPSQKNIHKLRDAKEEDDWGVRPDEGLDVSITVEQLENLFKVRQQRDLPLVASDAGEPKDERPTLLSADPQLKKAVETIETEQ